MNQRLQRLADQIQRDLSVLIRDEIKDPRLTGLITISNVKISPDLGYADIYVTVMEPTMDDAMQKDTYEQSLQVLNNASGFLRTELSRLLKTRTTPRLRFHYDEITANANYMMNLISKAVQSSEYHQTQNNQTKDDK